jgi:hypothetical protein
MALSYEFEEELDDPDGLRKEFYMLLKSPLSKFTPLDQCTFEQFESCGLYGVEDEFEDCTGLISRLLEDSQCSDVIVEYESFTVPHPDVCCWCCQSSSDTKTFIAFDYDSDERIKAFKLSIELQQASSCGTLLYSRYSEDVKVVPLSLYDVLKFKPMLIDMLFKEYDYHTVIDSLEAEVTGW